MTAELGIVIVMSVFCALCYATGFSEGQKSERQRWHDRLWRRAIEAATTPAPGGPGSEADHD